MLPEGLIQHPPEFSHAGPIEERTIRDLNLPSSKECSLGYHPPEAEEKCLVRIMANAFHNIGLCWFDCYHQ